MDKDQILVQKISRIYLHFLTPTVLAAATHSLYCMVDIIFISLAAGSTGLAAMNIAMPIFTFFTAIALLLGVGGATTISVCMGRGESDKADKVLTMVSVLCLAIGALISIFGSIFIVPFARALGATDALMPYVLEYMRPIVATTFMYMFSYAIQVLVRGDNNPKLVMAGTMCGNVFNIVFDYVFVMVFHWGILGASLATAIGPFLTVGIISMHYTKRLNKTKFVRRFWDFKLLLRVCRNGVATSLLEASTGMMTLVFNLLLLRLGGELYVAAYAVISNIAFVAKSVFGGIAQAAQPIISVNYGAGLYRRVREANRLSLVTALALSAAVYGVFLLFAKPVVGLFVHENAALLAVGAHALRLYFVSLALTAANTMLMYYFQSIEHSALSTAVSVCRGFVFVFAGLVLLTPLWQVDGVWLTMAFAELLTILFALPLAVITQKRLGRTRLLCPVQPQITLTTT